MTARSVDLRTDPDGDHFLHDLPRDHQRFAAVVTLPLHRLRVGSHRGQHHDLWHSITLEVQERRPTITRTSTRANRKDLLHRQTVQPDGASR